MNITFYSSVSKKEKVLGYIPEFKEHNTKFFKLSERDKLLAKASDTELLFIDAMGVFDKELIDSMPNLKLIMSEGVGYQGVDATYAREKGIPVCNNKGVNDTGVSEVALFLMLGCLRSFSKGVEEIYSGRQIEFKKASFGTKKELSQCTVGLIGFGDIARKTAEFCTVLGARVVYANRTRYKELEQKYNVTYLTIDELLKQSDIVSLHLAVTPQTTNLADNEFFAKMKNSAFLINTARGDLVDNEALKNALLSGEIAGAGLDVFTPEPLEKDNILLDDRLKDKLILTPHIAGITSLTVEKIYKNIYENMQNIACQKELKNRVN